MDIKNSPIGFFDSGVGGISVLREAVKLMPNEDFIYFGDSKNAPYGTKTTDEVKFLSFQASNYLISKGIKALVVACNTATSAAIEELRNTYTNIPVIGIEPAIKPAVELHRKGKILIMGTPMTLSEKKFNNLVTQYKDNIDILPLPCPGLVELIEDGIIDGDIIKKYLIAKLGNNIKEEIAAIVLGCTHYPFVKNEIAKLIGDDVTIIDGGLGTAKQLKRKLSCCELLNNKDTKGTVFVYNSSNENKVVELSYKLLEL